MEALYAFGRGDEADHAEVVCACGAEGVDCGDCGAAGGEHGIDEDDWPGVEVFGEFVEVGLGLEGCFVACEAEVSDACFGHDFEDSVGHAETCAEDGHDGDGLCEAVASGGGHGGLDVDVDGFEGSCDFVDHEASDLAEQGAEGSETGGVVAHPGEFVSDERMIEDDEVGVLGVW